MGSGETEHDATGALITLVAGHMLNVHPVMRAATATVGGSDPREGQEKVGGRGQDAVVRFTYSDVIHRAATWPRCRSTSAYLRSSSASATLRFTRSPLRV